MCKFAVLLLRLCGSSREKNMRRKKFPVCIERMFTQLIIDSEHRKSMEFQCAVFCEVQNLYLLSHKSHSICWEEKGRVISSLKNLLITSTVLLVAPRWGCAKRRVSFSTSFTAHSEKKSFHTPNPMIPTLFRVVRKSCSKNISLCFNVARRGWMGLSAFVD